jgi:hypothetical protein
MLPELKSKHFGQNYMQRLYKDETLPISLLLEDQAIHQLQIHLNQPKV